MSRDINRRSALKFLGAAAGSLSLSGIAASHAPASENALGTADTLAQLEGETIEWRRTYDIDGNDVARDVVSTDEGYAFAGSTVTDTGDSDAYLVVTDDTGETQWSRTFGGDGEQVVWGLVSVSDGYVLCGQEEEGAGTVFKLDSEGTEQWRTDVGTEIVDISRTADGGYAVVGLEMNSDADIYPILGKLAEDGSVEWTKRHRTVNAPSYFNAVVQTPDGGYAAAGYANLNANWTLKTDSEGNEEWSTAPREGEAQDVAVTADGDILSTGSVVGSGGFSPYLTRYALDGTVEFTTQYDAIDASSASAVTELSNGDIALSTAGFGLLVTDSEGTKQWFEDYDGEATSHTVTADDSVVVAGTTGGETGDTVLAKTRSLSTPEDAADDSRENATEIESGQQVSGTLTGQYDEDWYTFPVEQEETVSVDWNLTSPEDATLTYDYELRTPSGESIESAEAYQSQAGQYYLYIRPNDADVAPDPETHRYTFTVTVESEGSRSDDGSQGGDGGSDDSDGDSASDDDNGGVDVDEDEC